MCGRIIQASGPLLYRLVDGVDVPDSRLSNVPRRYNGAPNQELLVTRQNHDTGEPRSRVLTSPCAVFAQETTTGGAGAQTAPKPEIDACRASGLIALKEKSSAVKDVSLDLDSMRVIEVNSKVEDVPIKAIVLGDACIEKKKSGKAQTFVCIVGEKGKVLLTIFNITVALSEGF